MKNATAKTAVQEETTVAVLDGVTEEVTGQVLTEEAVTTPPWFATFWQENPGALVEIETGYLTVVDEDDVRIATIKAGSSDKDFKGFCTSLASVGQIQPLVVRINNNRLELVDGRRRLAGAQTLGWSAVKVIPAGGTGVMTRLEALTWAATANVAKKEMSPIDRYAAIQKMLDEGKASGSKITNKAIADALGMSTGSVSGYLSLGKFSDEARDAIDRGKVSYGTAITLMAQIGDAEKASKELLTLVTQADAAGAGPAKKPVGKSAATTAARKANEASGKGGQYQRSSAVMLAEFKAYRADVKNEVTKKGWADRMLTVLESYINGANTIKVTLKGLKTAAEYE